MPNPKRLLCGVVSENLVLLPKSIARQYAAERKAIFTLRGCRGCSRRSGLARA